MVAIAALSGIDSLRSQIRSGSAAPPRAVGASVVDPDILDSAVECVAPPPFTFPTYPERSTNPWGSPTTVPSSFTLAPSDVLTVARPEQVELLPEVAEAMSSA